MITGLPTFGVIFSEYSTTLKNTHQMSQSKKFQKQISSLID